MDNLDERLCEVFGVTKVIKYYQGVSGTKVIIVHNGRPRPVVLKIGGPELRNSIRREWENRRLLNPHLAGGIPRFLEFRELPQGYQGMTIKFVDGPNMHQAVVHGLLAETLIQRQWAALLDAKQKMWRATATPFELGKCRREYPSRAREIVRRVTEMTIEDHKFSSLLDYDVVINGREFPSLSRLLETIGDYRPPRWMVLSHGDLNGDNVVLDNYNGNAWKIVDLEWAGMHDWRESASRMLGWWQSNAVRLATQPTFTVNHHTRRITIKYEVIVPGVCREMIDRTMEVACNVASRLQEKKWLHELRKFLAIYFLRDIKFQPQRQREQFKIPMLGEAFRAIFPWDARKAKRY